MSTATTITTSTTSPNVTHLPHTPHAPHPVPLREHAFALHCQGLRSPAIAAELGVSERTIRAWIAAALADLKDDLQLSRKEQLLLAVERQNQLTVAAWHQFEREATARDALLDAALEVILAAANATDISARSVNVRLPASTPAPRYLSLILAANKETNRLLGLHTLARLHLLAPETLDLPDTDPTPLPESDIAAESATASSSPATNLVGASGGRPAASLATSRIAAESATAPAAPAFRPIHRAPARVPAGAQLARKRRRDSSLPRYSTSGKNGN